MLDTAEQFAPHLVPSAESVSRKFTMAFSKFADCYQIYNSGNKLSEDQIQLLSKKALTI